MELRQSFKFRLLGFFRYMTYWSSPFVLLSYIHIDLSFLLICMGLSLIMILYICVCAYVYMCVVLFCSIPFSCCSCSLHNKHRTPVHPKLTTRKDPYVRLMEKERIEKTNTSCIRRIPTMLIQIRRMVVHF